MIAAASHWHPDLLAVALILVFMAGLILIDRIERIRDHRRGRRLARQISQEPEAPRFFDQDEWDDWK